MVKIGAVSVVILALVGLYFSPVMSFARGGAGQSGVTGSSIVRDPKIVKRIDQVHMVMESDIGVELRAKGVKTGEAFIPAPTTKSEFQEATYTATVDGKPMEVVKDIRGRDVLHFTATQRTGTAKIVIDAKLYQADKTRDYRSPTPQTLTDHEKKLYLGSDDGWLNFNTPAFKREMVKKGLEAHAGESAHAYICRVYDYYLKHSTYSATDSNYGNTAVEAAEKFDHGDCKDYTMLFVNYGRANGYPCKANIDMPISNGQTLFHANLDVFSKDQGWFTIDPAHGISSQKTSKEVVGTSISGLTKDTMTEVRLGDDMDYLVNYKGKTYSLGMFMHGFMVYTGDNYIIVMPHVTHDFRGSK